jgi:hypothetical protein
LAHNNFKILSSSVILGTGSERPHCPLYIGIYYKTKGFPLTGSIINILTISKYIYIGEEKRDKNSLKSWAPVTHVYHPSYLEAETEKIVV